MHYRWLLAAVLLSACTTPYQPYKPFGVIVPRGGYQDFPVAGVQSGRHFISFESNPLTGKITVLESWHRRAAELCPEGYQVETVTCRCTDFILFQKRAEGYVRCTKPGERIEAKPAEKPAERPRPRVTGDIYRGE